MKTFDFKTFKEMPWRYLTYNYRFFAVIKHKLDSFSIFLYKFKFVSSYYLHTKKYDEDSIFILNGKFSEEDIRDIEIQYTESCHHDYDCCGCYYSTCRYQFSFLNYHFFRITTSQNV